MKDAGTESKQDRRRLNAFMTLMTSSTVETKFPWGQVPGSSSESIAGNDSRLCHSDNIIVSFAFVDELVAQHLPAGRKKCPPSHSFPM